VGTSFTGAVGRKVAWHMGQRASLPIASPGRRNTRRQLGHGTEVFMAWRS
jgi:hypothetical protein